MNLNSHSLPEHIAIIMDGNRRWAARNRLKAIDGHNYVVEKILEPLVAECAELGIPYLTLWAFSTENWTREKQEVDGIMRVFRKALDHKIEELMEKGVRFKIIGCIEAFPEDICSKLKMIVLKSAANKKITVNLALNYGGRDEIVRAVKKTIETLSLQDKSHDEPTLVKSLLESSLDTFGQPDPDLIIRTGGVQRLSGFMSWQSAYSELYFTDILMPEFSVPQLHQALEDFGKRERRFGGGSFKNYLSRLTTSRY